MGATTWALSNAPADTELSQLAGWKCQRYFVERANQEAKSELGWDELQARKYLAWEHHLALTVLASWFIAANQIRLGTNLSTVILTLLQGPGRGSLTRLIVCQCPHPVARRYAATTTQSTTGYRSGH